MYAWDLNTEVNNKYNKNRPFTQQDITYDYEPQNLDFSKTEDSIPLSETSSEKKTDSIDLSSKKDLQYVELFNNQFSNYIFNKCWKNSAIQVLYYLEDFRNAILNLINTSYNDELLEKLKEINNYNKFYNENNWKSTLNEIHKNYTENPILNKTLIIPALYSIINEMNKLELQDLTNEELKTFFADKNINVSEDDYDTYRKVYMGLKEHFVFVATEGVETPSLFGGPAGIFSSIGLLKNFDDDNTHNINYVNSMKKIFGYKKIEFCTIYDSSLNQIHRFLDSSTMGYNIIKTNETDSANIIPTSDIDILTILAEKQFFLNDYYFNNIDKEQITSEYIEKYSENKIFENYEANFKLSNLDVYIRNNIFSKYTFYDINILKNEQSKLFNTIINKLQDKKIIEEKRKIHNELHINKDTDVDNILTKIQSFFIELPKYYMISLGQNPINISEHLEYENIYLPLLDTTKENDLTHIDIKYNIKAIILQPGPHFTCIIKINGNWIFFDSDNLNRNTITGDEVNKAVKNDAKYFIYERDTEQKNSYPGIDNKEIIAELQNIIEYMNNTNNENIFEDDDTNEDTIQEILGKSLDLLIINHLSIYKNYVTMPNKEIFTEFVSIIYKYIISVLIICKYSDKIITKEFIQNTIEYCLRYLFTNNDDNVKIIYKTLEATLTLELFNTIYQQIDNLSEERKNIDTLFNLQFNQLTMKKYKSKIIHLIENNAEKNKLFKSKTLPQSLSDNVTTTLQEYDTKIVPNVTVEQPKFSELEETVIDTIESFSDTEETIQQDMNVTTSEVNEDTKAKAEAEEKALAEKAKKEADAKAKEAAKTQEKIVDEKDTIETKKVINKSQKISDESKYLIELAEDQLSSQASNKSDKISDKTSSEEEQISDTTISEEEQKSDTLSESYKEPEKYKNKLRNILLSDDIFNNENQSEMWIFDISEIIINNLEIISNEDAFKIISFYNEIDTLNLKKDIELSIFEKENENELLIILFKIYLFIKKNKIIDNTQLEEFYYQIFDNDGINEDIENLRDIILNNLPIENNEEEIIPIDFLNEDITLRLKITKLTNTKYSLKLWIIKDDESGSESESDDESESDEDSEKKNEYTGGYTYSSSYDSDSSSVDVSTLSESESIDISTFSDLEYDKITTE